MELNGHQLAGRQRIVGAMVLGVGLLFVFRLFQMQVTTDDWKNRAERLTEEQEVLQPARDFASTVTGNPREQRAELRPDGGAPLAVRRGHFCPR